MAVTETGHSALRVAGAGLTAGLAQTAAVYVLAAVFDLTVTDMSAFVGSVLAGPAPAAIAAGRWLFALMAVIWAFLYRRVGPGLPGPAWQRGLLFGGLVWAFSTVALLPLLAAVASSGTRPGLFGLGFGGVPAALTALTAHLVYGVVLALSLRRADEPPVPGPGPA